jgi:hypothetical protein
MEVDGVLPMRLSDTADIFVRFGPGDRSLLDLIDGWCGHVMKLYDDTSRPAEDAWTVHDLIASLYLRDGVQRGIDSRSEDAASISAVAAADEVFKSFTIEDPDDLLTRFDPDVPVSPWWWKRLPAHGPIDEEIRRLKQT